MSLRASVLFHLNLGYSSIDEAERGEVLDRCYRPLLELLDHVPGLVLAVEAGVATLEQARALAPDWFERLAAEVRAGRVELIGSGDSQVIGPLVPARVHRWNQELGMAGYGDLLGTYPRTALVNEMAWSQGIVDAYLEVGYGTLLMEWNNPRRHHPEWEEEWRYGASWTRSATGERARVLWIDAVAFQKLQRAAVGDLTVDEYRAWLAGMRPADGADPRHLFLYASDAEVFDYRPGRYATEPALHPSGEWSRVAELLRVAAASGVRFTSPGAVAEDPAFAPRGEVRLNSWADPIPVKKQPKYNVTRWALSGRDDVGLNARCFARHAELETRRDADGLVPVSDMDRRDLCRAWTSDHRTHLTDARWAELNARAATPPRVEPAAVAVAFSAPLGHADTRREGRRLWVTTDGVALELNLRRGLAIESLAFPGVHDAPLLGTLPHGLFDDIAWAADFYSGHAVAEIPPRQRVADLERVEPELHVDDTTITVWTEVPTALGPLTKRVVVGRDRVRLESDFSRWGERPAGSLRAGIVTLLPPEHGGALGPELALTAAQGGAPERFEVRGECDHGAAVSPLVSARAAFGATDGRLVLDDGAVALDLAWDPARAAALPLLTVREIEGLRFVRLAFSLSEIDDTHRPGAPLPDFALELGARKLR